MKRKSPKPRTFPNDGRPLLRFLAKKRNRISPLLILTHDFPDPDALASAFALQYIAERVYKIQSRIVHGGIVGRMENREMIRLLKIPVHKIRSEEIKKYPCVALVDTQPEFRNNSFPKSRRATIVIDQHASVRKPNSEFAIVDPECGATSVILTKALLALKREIPKSIATALVYGILSDTLDLYRAKRADVIETYLKIIHRCDLRALAHIQNPSRSKRFFQTLGQGIHNAVTWKGLVVSHLEEISNPDLVAQVAEFLMTYEKCRWSFCTGRFHDRLYVSLRASHAATKAGNLLRDILVQRENAGGHGTIAGGSFQVGKNVSERMWKRVEHRLIERLLKRLRIPSKSRFYRPFSN